MAMAMAMASFPLVAARSTPCRSPRSTPLHSIPLPLPLPSFSGRRRADDSLSPQAPNPHHPPPTHHAADTKRPRVDHQPSQSQSPPPLSPRTPTRSPCAPIQSAHCVLGAVSNPTFAISHRDPAFTPLGSFSDTGHPGPPPSPAGYIISSLSTRRSPFTSHLVHFRRCIVVDSLGRSTEQARPRTERV